MANNTLAHPTDITSNDRAGLLGILWAIYGIVRLVIALVLIFFNGVATVIFGALLTRVPNPFALMTDFHILYVFIIVWNILSAKYDGQNDESLVWDIAGETGTITIPLDGPLGHGLSGTILFGPTSVTAPEPSSLLLLGSGLLGLVGIARRRLLNS